MKNGMYEYDGGMRAWYKNDKLHREDGPALIEHDSKTWYKEGKIHREDGPAVIDEDGYKCWLKNGVLHREDGPAIEYPDGTKEWYLHGELVYSDNIDRTHKLNLCDTMKRSIVKYKLSKLS